MKTNLTLFHSCTKKIENLLFTFVILYLLSLSLRLFGVPKTGTLVDVIVITILIPYVNTNTTYQFQIDHDNNLLSIIDLNKQIDYTPETQLVYSFDKDVSEYTLLFLRKENGLIENLLGPKRKSRANLSKKALNQLIHSLSLTLQIEVVTVEEDNFKLIDELRNYQSENLSNKLLIFRITDCLECGKKLESKANYCWSCGNKRPTCIVCKAIVDESEKLLKCPNCNVLGHGDDLVK